MGDQRSNQLNGGTSNTTTTIMNTQHETDDLERMAPTLHRLKGRDPMRVPQDFFEHFPHAVQKQVNDAERTPPAAAIWLRRLAWSLPMASLLLVALLIWWPSNTSEHLNGTVTTNGNSSCWWDLFDDDLLRETVLEEAEGPTPHTLDLDDDEWLAYWEDQGLLDLYMDQNLQ